MDTLEIFTDGKRKFIRLEKHGGGLMKEGKTIPTNLTTPPLPQHTHTHTVERERERERERELRMVIHAALATRIIPPHSEMVIKAVDSL